MRLNSVYILFAVLGLCTSLAGCGQKGPLYLPDSQQEQQR